MLDVAITGGLILDGTGHKAFRADVGISNGKIVEIAQTVSSADVKIDASNRTVSPGFIDVHSHSDLTLLIDPMAQSKLRQGVTTEVNGNCGFAVAPIFEDNMGSFINFWKSSGSEWFDIEPTWRSFAEYLSTLEGMRPALNVGVLAGHGTIRFATMAVAPRTATDDELAKMETLTDECIRSGACGLSSGLRYVPGSYADERELVALCRVVARYGGVYATHMRSEGDNGSWEDAVLEAVYVANRAGVPLQISHLKALSKNVWNTSARILGLCESLRRQGMDLTADQYPYDAAHTGLTIFLPKEMNVGDLLSLDNAKKQEVIDHIHRVLDLRGGPKRIIIISSPEGQFDGRDIEQISKQLGMVPGETILKLIVDFHGEISIVSVSMLEEDIQNIMKAQYVMVATDGYSIAPEGAVAVGIPHPRSYGTFPRVLGRYVRDLGLLNLEEAVRKMTSLPATKFRFEHRGIIELDAHADIVVFDPRTIEDRSTFSSATKYPKGIDYVLVNGKITIDRERHTGEREGKILKNSTSL